jgi:uncharacterized protein DUF4129
VRRVRLVAAAVLVVGFVGAAGTSANAQPQIPLSEYVTRLDATLTRLHALPTDGDHVAISGALAPLGLPLDVLTPGGGSVEVTEQTLIGSTRTYLSLEQTTARVGAALSAARAAASTEGPDLAGLRSALAKAYQGQTPSQPSLAERIFVDIGQVIGWIFDHTLGAVARSGLGEAIAWLLVAGVLVAVWLFVRRVQSAAVHEASVTLTGISVPRIDWRREADRALAAGDLVEAVRALYHLMLAALAARGVVHDAPSLTAGECRRAVGIQRPALSPAVDAATATFERVVFGKVPPGDADIEVLRAAERAVRKA